MDRDISGQTDYEGVVFDLGLPIVSETYTNILTYCPFHSNNDTPALSISKEEGLWKCFNPNCDASGGMTDLVKSVLNCNEFQALRYISKHKREINSISDDILSILRSEKMEFKDFGMDKINMLSEGLPGSDGESYMLGRGFDKNTLSHFEIGYSPVMRMVSVPIFSHTEIPLGIVGRSIEGKRFKNSAGLPTAHLFHNLNRVRKETDTAIVVESAFDVMRLYQLGFTNGIATLGSHVSPYKINLLNKYFNRIILMTDNDNAGRKLGNKISDGFMRRVDWADMPDGCKDAGDMTFEQIGAAIKNSIPNYEYKSGLTAI